MTAGDFGVQWTSIGNGMNSLRKLPKWDKVFNMLFTINEKITTLAVI